MRIIQLDTKAFLASKEEKKFIILGSEEAAKPDYVNKMVMPKINRETKDPVPGFWGTLGFSDDKSIDWSGHIEISGDGNDSFQGVVEEEVKLIKTCFPELNDVPSGIKERFISFEHIDFSYRDIFTLDDIPHLRLDVMLGTDEGALVFYQSDRINNEDSSIEYILPQATPDNNVNDRDRLTYIFDIIPQYKTEPIPAIPGMYRLTTTKEVKPFIVKVLIFKRSFGEKDKGTMKNSKELLIGVENRLRKNITKVITKEHVLLVYNCTTNSFDHADSHNINADKKTLFLMHGTFGSTQTSFGALYGDEGKWLKDISEETAKMHYEQIIAFDHPTVFNGAEENTYALFGIFDSLGIDKFTKEVDFIGTSQGGVIIQYLANLDQARIKVGKAALVASANGVGYFTAGGYISKFLTVLKYVFKYTGMELQAIITAFAQHSVDFLLKQPGFEIMTPGNEKLDSIINTAPFRKETLYLPIIDDYDESLVEEEERKVVRFFKRIGANSIDSIAKTMLGEENDWVVGTKNQFIVPCDHCAIPNYNPGKYREYKIPAIHGTCVKKPKAQEKLKGFLLSTPVQALTVPVSTDYFDAHCHIFGREVISGRILLLLIDELISYKASRIEGEKLPLIKDITKYQETLSPSDKTGSVAANIIKYFALNSNSYQMLNDLENEYYKLSSGVYRYIPLMFDLEMSFRNNYKSDDEANNMLEIEGHFKDLIHEYLEDIEKLIDRFEKGKELPFTGSFVENEESIKALKIIKTCINLFKVVETSNLQGADTGYYKQIEEMKGLKNRYGNNIFPFLAVDPRRAGMAGLIKENVGAGKPFYGIKLYAPNGYSPTDPNLFDDSSGFINDKCLYSYCCEHSIPVMAHCSNAGFSTFVKDLQVWGDIHLDGKPVHYDELTTFTFNNNIFNGGFGESVRERASVLNHPKLWGKVLSVHQNLQLCLAHFGGESQEWRDEIAGLMRIHTTLYTDLSCCVIKDRLKAIKEEYYDKNDEIVNRIMYGSDFFLNMLNDITFESYFKSFRSIFSEKQIKEMCLEIPRKYLLM
jgi:predicted TIM-barrel fold metal-dependent hydrolase